jgi:AcrR family transcriptional regulator
MTDDFFVAEDDPPSKREVLRVALHLFVKDGLCETSIRDIAKASGYTNPALYKFFASKEELAVHLLERCYLRLVSAIRASQRGERFGDDLDALVDAYARLVDEHLEAVIFVNEQLRPLWRKLPRAARAHSLIDTVQTLITRGVEAGAVAKGTDLDLAAAMVLGTMGQVARLVYFDEIAPPLAQHVSGIRTLFRRALTGRAS